MSSHVALYSVHEDFLLEMVGILDLAAVAVYAITGALIAARREMDWLGFVVVGVVTGVGGGTLRDVSLGVQPVFWVTDPNYVIICIFAAILTYWMVRCIESRYQALLWADSIGLSLYCVIGAFKAELFDAAPIVSIMMGVMTATFGGLMRDIMCGERSLLFKPEVYATAALVGSLVFVASGHMNVPLELRAVAGFCAAFFLRAGAIRWGWALPRYRHPSRSVSGDVSAPRN